MTEFEPSTEVNSRLEVMSRLGRNVCMQIRLAADSMKMAQAAIEVANSAASGAKLESVLLYEKDRLKFLVELPEDDEDSFISNDGDVVETRPLQFVATELRSVSRHGLEFYNGESGQELHLKGFNFDISSILPEPE